MISEANQNDFYEGRRSEELPFAVNDVVVVKQGRKPDAIAWVISIAAEPPSARYLVEYEDGSSDIVALKHLKLHQN